MKERRKFDRENLIDIVRYAPSPDATDTILKGALQNYSSSGLCFITHHALQDDQEIVLKSIVTPNAKRAVVKWREDIGNGNYRVGLEFFKG